MLRGAQIAETGLTEWRKLAQGLHARYRTDDFAAGARFVADVGEAGDEIGHHPRVTIGRGHVDLELVTADAIYREDEGTEHVVEWVTQQDVDLARRVTEIAAEHGLVADPASVSEIELGLDTADSATIAPVWAALLTGDATSQGRGSPGRRGAGRHRAGAEPVVRRRGRGRRPGAAVPRRGLRGARGARAAGRGSRGGWREGRRGRQRGALAVIEDQDGNRGVICVDTSAVQQG